MLKRFNQETSVSSYVPVHKTQTFYSYLHNQWRIKQAATCTVADEVPTQWALAL